VKKELDEIPMSGTQEDTIYEEDDNLIHENIVELLSEIKKIKPFRKFVYKDIVFIEKVIAKSDLSFRGACIQGDVRLWLNIEQENKKIYLIDNRTDNTAEVHFNPQGRMAGINFWLRDHSDIIVGMAF
jgi:hypothetical protein